MGEGQRALDIAVKPPGYSGCKIQKTFPEQKRQPLLLQHSRQVWSSAGPHPLFSVYVLWAHSQGLFYLKPATPDKKISPRVLRVTEERGSISKPHSWSPSRLDEDQQENHLGFYVLPRVGVLAQAHADLQRLLNTKCFSHDSDSWNLTLPPLESYRTDGNRVTLRHTATGNGPGATCLSQ